MSKGYPTRATEAPLPELGLPADACLVCKRRPAAKGGLCAACDEALKA